MWITIHKWPDNLAKKAPSSIAAGPPQPKYFSFPIDRQRAFCRNDRTLFLRLDAENFSQKWEWRDPHGREQI
jgi:hypothetical protein